MGNFSDTSPAIIRAHFEAHILGAIQADHFTGDESDKDKLQWARDRFESEYNYADNKRRQGWPMDRTRGVQPMNARKYMGVLLSPAYGAAARNGFRWQCHIEGAGFLYADTLAGIKRCMRDALAAALERRNAWSLYERRAGGVVAYLGTVEGGLSTIERDYGQRARRIDKRNFTVWL